MGEGEERRVVYLPCALRWDRAVDADTFESQRQGRFLYFLKCLCGWLECSPFRPHLTLSSGTHCMWKYLSISNFINRLESRV